ncbi:hypothetical protein Acr_08g0014030 [Actinidia rufa]|uniref:Uncharacterized protein n=1 Tax=Actinidia rufa TaxID=165716 RepID=A0A7J0F4Z9_9ERIC|nr:hypothetical protein Acr_08g0014030 [Actinidia rufa]
MDALMQRKDLEFTTENLLHVYYVVKPRKNLKTQMLEGNHYLRLRKPNQPQTRLVMDSPDKDQYLNDFVWISSQWEFSYGAPDLFSIPRYRGYVPVAAISVVNNYGRARKVSDLIDYVPLYHYTIPLQFARIGHPVLPPLRIRDQAPGQGAHSRTSWDIDLGDEGDDEEAKGEDGKEVNQVPTAAPLVPTLDSIIVPSSNSDCANDIAIVETSEIVDEVPNPAMPVLTEDQSVMPSSMAGGKRKGKQPIEGTYRQKKGKRTRSKDHETCVALGNVVMLPQDVADHAAETSAEFKGKLFQLPASPGRYSPMILPDFNKEKYPTLPVDEGDVNIAGGGVLDDRSAVPLSFRMAGLSSVIGVATKMKLP